MPRLYFMLCLLLVSACARDEGQLALDQTEGETVWLSVRPYFSVVGRTRHVEYDLGWVLPDDASPREVSIEVLQLLPPPNPDDAPHSEQLRLRRAEVETRLRPGTNHVDLDPGRVFFGTTPVHFPHPRVHGCHAPRWYLIVVIEDGDDTTSLLLEVDAETEEFVDAGTIDQPTVDALRAGQWFDPEAPQWHLAPIFDADCFDP